VKLTDLKNVKPKNITLQDANEEYADYLYALPESKSKKQIWTVVGTVAAAVVIVMGVSLWAIIGRGVRGAGEPDGEYFMQAGSDTSSDTTQKPELAHRVIVSVDDKYSDYEEGSYLLTDADAKALIAALKAKKRTEHTVAADGMIRISTPDEQFSLYIGDDSCHINCKDGGISLTHDDEIITIVKKYIKKKEISSEQPDGSVLKDAVRIDLGENSVGYRTGQYTITGDDAQKIIASINSKTFASEWNGFGPAFTVKLYVGEKQYDLQVCVTEVKYRLATADFKTELLDKNDNIVKIIEKYLLKVEQPTADVIIEKINAKGSFANEYRVPADEARNLLTLLKANGDDELYYSDSAKNCICMPTHRIKYDGKVYNVSITTRDFSHFTVDNRRYDFTTGEYYNIYEIFQKFVSKDYFVVTKKIDTEFKCPGDIKVKAKIKDYLKEIGQLWPSSPEFMEFTITGKEADAFYRGMRLKTYMHYKKYHSNDYIAELEIDGKNYWFGSAIETENGEMCYLEADDELRVLYEGLYNEALREQGFDKATLEKRKNLVAYEKSIIETCSDPPPAFCFDSVDEAVKAIKTHEYTIGDDERKAMEAEYARIIDEQERIDAISKIGTKDDHRFEGFRIDNINYFYKLKSELRDFELDGIYVSSEYINFYYKLKSNSNLAEDSKITVHYLRPDTFAFETESYFDDYVEYYGTSVLTEDNIIYEKWSSNDRIATAIIAAGNSIIEITASGDMADYDTLKRICNVQKVTVK